MFVSTMVSFSIVRTFAGTSHLHARKHVTVYAGFLSGAFLFATEKICIAFRSSASRLADWTEGHRHCSPVSGRTSCKQATRCPRNIILVCAFGNPSQLSRKGPLI